MNSATEMVIEITCIIHSVVMFVGVLAAVKYLVYSKWE